MAFPTVQTADTKIGSDASGSTSHTITYCTNIASGDLLILLFIIDAAGTVSGYPSGWSQIIGGATSPRVVGHYKIADGTETGTFTLTTSDSELGAFIMHRITGWHGTTAPEVSTQATGSSSGPDANSLTPSWGSDTTLWVTLEGHGNSTITVSSYPTNYTSLNTVGQNTSTSPRISSAYFQNSAASEDAGAFTLSSSATWRATTIAIRPPIGGATGAYQ